MLCARQNNKCKVPLSPRGADCLEFRPYSGPSYFIGVFVFESNKNVTVVQAINRRVFKPEVK